MLMIYVLHFTCSLIDGILTFFLLLKFVTKTLADISVVHVSMDILGRLSGALEGRALASLHMHEAVITPGDQ